MPLDGVSVKRILSARRERVFEAWTHPELMGRWFFPGAGWTAEVTAELRVGGRYQLAMRDAGGIHHLQFGEYREVTPVSRLVFTWSCPELEVVDSVVTVELIDRGERTELLLTHDLPPDPRIRRGHEEGWVGCLGNLEAMFEHHPEKETVMSAIKDEIRIQGSAGKVYEALSRQAGYRAWWNKAGEVPEVVGGEAKLYFVKDGTPVNMRFRIDEMNTNDGVRWTCTAHDMPTWIGTTLDWRIKQAGDAVLVLFEHAGWKDAAPDPVAQGWKHFLGSLKSYVETGTGQPW